MKWFKHDSDASIDAKLQTLLLDYGAAGYGLYWYCVELIVQGVGENNITFELEHDARIIARNLNLSIIETQNMIQKMIELNLFSITENNKLACYALAKRLDQSMTSNPSMRALISNLKTQNHDKVMTKSTMSHDKVKTEEKRREEIREEEKREEKILPKSYDSESDFSLSRDTHYDNLSKEYKEALQVFIESMGLSYPFDDFVNSLQAKASYKYKNFVKTYRTWAKNHIPKQAPQQRMDISKLPEGVSLQDMLNEAGEQWEREQEQKQIGGVR